MKDRTHYKIIFTLLSLKVMKVSYITGLHLIFHTKMLDAASASTIHHGDRTFHIALPLFRKLHYTIGDILV